MTLRADEFLPTSGIGGHRSAALISREPSEPNAICSARKIPREPNATYSERKVSRAKALLTSGMKVSAVARLIKAPYNTVRDWKLGKRCAEVPMDAGVLAYLEALWD